MDVLLLKDTRVAGSGITKLALTIMLIVSLSFSSLVWQTALDSKITSKVLQFGNNLLVATDGGYAYLLNPSSGGITTKTAVGAHMLQPVISDSNAYLSTSGGRLVQMNSNGVLQWSIDLTGKSYNITYFYGIDVYGEWIYITAKEGVCRIRTSGKDFSIIYNTTATLTAPATGPGYVLFGEGSQLVRLDTATRAMTWKSPVSGKFWTSVPLVSGTSVYVGALDNNLYSFSLPGGYVQYSVQTNNWVMSTPTIANGMVYFGSNDGKVYAVDALSGRTKWAANIGRAVQTKPEVGYLGGKSVVFVGCNDNNIYAIETNDGMIVWKGSAAGWVESPLYFQGKIIFGSMDSRVYSYSTERACSITGPLEGDIVGLKEVVVKGSAVSEAGSMKVHVRINNEPWEEAELYPGGNWTFYIDPAKKLNTGLNTVSCRVSDALGEESGVFTTVTLNRGIGAQPSNFIVEISPASPKVNGPLTIYINDGDDGSPVERFTASIDGKQVSGSNNITIVANESREYLIMISKIGFNDVNAKVQVYSDELPVYYYIIGAIALGVVLYILYGKLAKR